MRMAITVLDIRRMVEAFYARVGEDPLLSPIFEARVAGQWPAHLEKMVNFWSGALLGGGGYAGNPRAVHAGIVGIGGEHFERWLSLFHDTVESLFDPVTAQSIHGRAQAMARGLLHGIANRRPGLAMTEREERHHG